MSGQDWKSVDGAQLDELLEREAPEVPPERVAHGVTPWRRGIERTVLGLGLSAVSLDLTILEGVPLLEDLFQPLCTLLAVLGLRSLRRENLWFRLCWAMALFRGGWQLFGLVMGTTTCWRAVSAALPVRVLAQVNLVVMLAIYFCLWQAIRAVQRKAGMPPGAWSGAVLTVWYGAVALVVSATGTIRGWPVLALILSYAVALRCLLELGRALDRAGYVIRPAPVRLPDWALTAVILLVLGVGAACGLMLFRSYPMDGQPQQELSAQAEQVRTELLEMGFPEEILADLTEQDVLACQGAVRVGYYMSDNGETVDGGQLSFQAVFVQLPGERVRWKIFQHFQWTRPPQFRGYEAIRLQPSYLLGRDGWAEGSAVTGQVLWDRDGRSWTAPYYDLFQGSRGQSGQAVYAAFSFPGEGEELRGYLAHTIAETKPGVVAVSYLAYAHQTGRLEFPRRTGVEFLMEDAPFAGSEGDFEEVSGSTQFYPDWMMEG